MFQNLSQGSFITILFKNAPRVADGKILAVNTHLPVYQPGQPPMAMFNGPVTDITVQVDNDTIPFAGLPANGVTANFPDKGYFIAIDRSAVVKELESMVTASKQVLEQVPAHQKMVQDCEALLLQLQPEKKKEAQQAQEIEGLKTQLSLMNGKFDKLASMISARLGTVNTMEE